MIDLKSLAPTPLTWMSSDVGLPKKLNTLPKGIGGFRLSAYYGGQVSHLSRRQFTGRADLELSDQEYGQAAVAIADIGLMNLAYIRSTGHEVVLTEMQRPNLLVLVSGTLSSKNGSKRVDLNCEPWVLFGRGRRLTRVSAIDCLDYEAFVLSMPPSFLGHDLEMIEARGGQVTGDATADADVLLARLTLELATQLTLCGDTAMDKRLAEAWTTILTGQIRRCLEKHVGQGAPELPKNVPELTLSYVRRAEERIYQRPEEVSGVGELASFVGVSERTLQSAFRRVRGATPTQVLSQARLQYARRALMDPDGQDSVSAVCRMCGFEHHGRFSILYKEVYGEHPGSTLNSRKAKK